MFILCFQWKDYVQPQCGDVWPAKTQYDAVSGRCQTSYPSKRLYYTFFSVALFFLPVTIMSFTYLLLLWRLWMSRLPGELSNTAVSIQARAKRKVSVYIQSKNILVKISQIFTTNKTHSPTPLKTTLNMKRYKESNNNFDIYYENLLTKNVIAITDLQSSVESCSHFHNCVREWDAIRKLARVIYFYISVFSFTIFRTHVGHSLFNDVTCKQFVEDICY